MTLGRRLAMFPLGTPLLPGGLLPLHVFELRYRMMMDDVLHTESKEFGVVLIERGHEVGGGDLRTAVGTLARVVRDEELEDGRRGVLAVGVRRLRVATWLPDDPYPVAEVTDWPVDPIVGDEDLITRRLVDAVDRLIGLFRRIDDRIPGVEPRSHEETLAEYVYRVASVVPIGPADRQRVLEAGDAAAGVTCVTQALDDLEASVRFRYQLDGPDG